MSYERKDNTSSTFKNTRKEKETHPDYTGTALIDGVEYWHSMWGKRRDDGSVWFSHSYKKKEVGTGGGVLITDVPKAAASQGAAASYDVDIPF